MGLCNLAHRTPLEFLNFITCLPTEKFLSLWSFISINYQQLALHKKVFDLCNLTLIFFKVPFGAHELFTSLKHLRNQVPAHNFGQVSKLFWAQPTTEGDGIGFLAVYLSMNPSAEEVQKLRILRPDQEVSFASSKYQALLKSYSAVFPHYKQARIELHLREQGLAPPQRQPSHNKKQRERPKQADDRPKRTDKFTEIFNNVADKVDQFFSNEPQVRGGMKKPPEVLPRKEPPKTPQTCPAALSVPLQAPSTFKVNITKGKPSPQHRRAYLQAPPAYHSYSGY